MSMMKEGNKASGSSTEQPSSSSASASATASPQPTEMAMPESPSALLHSPDPVARQREIEREIRIAEEFEKEQHKQHEHDRQRFLLGQSYGASAEAAAAGAGARRGSGSGSSGERKQAGAGARRTPVLHGHLLTTKIESALVRQAASEFASANAYLAASLWFDERSFKGFAKLMLHESKDELREGYALMQYIVQRRGHYRVRDVPAPAVTEWTSAEKVIESLYQQEVRTANRINDMVALCRTSGDVSTELFLHKFVRHQTDACDTMHTLLEKVSAFESSSSAQLFNMDKDLLHHGDDSIRGRSGGRKKDADAGASTKDSKHKCK